MTIKINILQANHGDCFLLTQTDQGKVFNVLIDGGNSSTFKSGIRDRDKGALCKKLDELRQLNQKIDLAVLTHIDDDHIGGMLKGFNCDGYLKDMVERIWYYSSNTITNYLKAPSIPENEIYLNNGSALTGIGQGKALDKIIEDLGCERIPVLLRGESIKIGPFLFKILSPTLQKLEELLCIWPTEPTLPFTSTVKNDHSERFEDLLKEDVFKEDQSITNGSSIAFLIEAENRKMIFLGDAHDSSIIGSLNDLGYTPQNHLHLDLVKISHHGSEYNTSAEFLELVRARNFIISTNGRKHGLPDKKTIARILASDDKSMISFNYQEVIESLTKVPEKPELVARLTLIQDEIEL